MFSPPEKQDPAFSKLSLFAFITLLLGAVAGVFLNGSAPQGAQGVFLSAAGVVLLVAPAKIRIENRLWVLLGAFLLLSAGALLPQAYFPMPGWRQSLEGLPIPLGDKISPVPAETLFYLGILSISGVLILFCLSHPVHLRALPRLATGAALVALIYAGLAVYASKTGWKYPFDDDESFGFFPNRNQTATFLMTGCLISIGILSMGSRERKWGMALIAATSLTVCGTALLIYSGSRGGIIFLFVGVVLWFLLIGKSGWSKPLVVSVVVVCLACSVLFIVAKGEARNRLFKMAGWEKDSRPIEQANISKTRQEQKEPTLDGRILIYKDTWRMICQQPWTGVGLGAYQYIYPFYQRNSLSEMTSIHPESDWLMTAAESGLPSLFALCLGAVVLFARIKSQKTSRYWPLRCGLIAAVLAAILHGVVDVPFHRTALGWWLLLIMAAALQIAPEKVEKPFFWHKLLFCLTGIGAVFAGVFLIRAEWFQGPSSPPYRAKKAAARIYELYKVDPKEATEFTTQEILKSPMAEGLYHQKALLRLIEEGTDLEVDNLFLAERTLSPTWPQTSVLQGFGWIDNDQKRACQLWLDGLRRMRKIDAQRGNEIKSTLALYANLLSRSQKFPDVQQGLYEASGQNPEMKLQWVESVNAEIAGAKISELGRDLTFLEALQPIERQRFLKTWYEKADREALFQFAAQRPDWSEAVWPLQIRQLVEFRKFQTAVESMSTRYHLDLSLPVQKLSPNPSSIEGDSDPVSNFNRYWKVGNEVTARRKLVEARAALEKAPKNNPEFWRINAALAIHDQRWEEAFSYLRRYLVELGLDTSL